MREFKFRAWDKRQNKMFWIDEIVFFNQDHSIFDVRLIDEPERDMTNRRTPEDIELMQYTGLHDKNGKEIWEGDILKRPGWESISVVKWYQPMSAFLRVLQNVDGVQPSLYDAEYFEVIGNVWENPELLETKEK